jgi:gamma-glutamyltranspeptidase/glutathione hydrolase
LTSRFLWFSSARWLALIAFWASVASTAPALREESAASSPRRGIVVAASPGAARAGAEILARGGNAVDAAVATALALTVAEPGMSGLGGRTVMIVGWPNGEAAGLDGATAWPKKWIALRKAGRKIPPPRGWGQVAIPGTYAALAEASRRWGRLPFSVLAKPAIRLAREGFVVSRIQERLFAGSRKDLAKDPTLRKIYLHSNGEPYRAGERLRQPELARTYELFARRGPSLFREGSIARAIAKEMKLHGGYVAESDLKGFRAKSALLDSIRYRKVRIVAADRPTEGRKLLWRMRTLERLPSYASPADRLQTLIELLNIEPESVKFESDAGNRRRLLFGDSVAQAVRSIENRVKNRAAGPPSAASPKTDTTHLVVADRNGMVVSLTQSLGPFFGAKVALPNYGITFAATMGYLDDRDVSKAPISSICPMVVFDSAKRPILAIGGAGSDRIPQVLAQALHHALDERMSIVEAVAAPRLVVDRDERGGTSRIYWDGARDPKNAESLREMKRRGYAILPTPPGGALGRIHALMRQADGSWRGAPDPRWFGVSLSQKLYVK